MESRSERRRSPRVETKNLAGSMAFSLSAEILNVSRGGLALRAKHQLRIGSAYHIQVGDKERAVQLTGIVRRCKLRGIEKNPESGDTEPIYEAGIKFEPALSEEMDELLPVMAGAVSLNLAPRLFGRFLAQPDAEAILSADHEFEVKKISLSGLLAESEGAPLPVESIALEIGLGDTGSFASRAVIVDVRMMPSGSDGEPRSQYAIEFVDPEEEALGRLEAFVLGKLETGL